MLVAGPNPARATEDDRPKGSADNHPSMLHSASRVLNHAFNEDNDIFVATSDWVDITGGDAESQHKFLPSDDASTELGAVPYDSADMEGYQKVVQRIVAEGDILGRGSFGTVYKGQIKGVAVAVKVLSFQGAEDVRNEFLMSLVLSHKHLVRTYMAFQQKITPGCSAQSPAEDATIGTGFDAIAHMHPINLEEQRAGLTAERTGAYWESSGNGKGCAAGSDGAFYECCIVQELCNGGDMYHAIKSGCIAGEGHVKRCLALACDVARGLAYMHKFNIVHLDLKPQNVLISKAPGERPVAKIADFGLSRAMPADMDTVCVDQHGTAIYCPEEMLTEGIVSPTADLYALALIIGEMLTGKMFYEGLSMAQAVVAVFNEGLRPDLPKWVPSALRTLLEDSWSSDRTRRPTTKTFYAELRRIYRELE